MQYIGARYTPKFMTDPWDPTQAYENLCVVNNGMGTSYISNKPVPAGTPLTDTEYWAIYGSYSGAILDLQNRVGTLETEALEIPEKDYIALGDVEITRYKFSTYLVDIAKISHFKNDGVTPNVPIIIGTNTAQHMSKYVKNGKLATNIGYYTNNQSFGSMLSQGVKHVGDVLTDPDMCYMAIGNDGSLEHFDYTTSIDTIAAAGYDNAAAVRCRLIHEGAPDPSNPLSRFMQQIFGIDYDGNYYAITTSYYCTLTSAQQIAWIIATIPTIKEAFALDSGGSAQTYVAGMRTNLETDITSDGMGREVAGALVIPVDHVDSDINRLMNIFTENQNLAPKKLVSIGSDISVGTNIEAWTTEVYQIGNMVIGTYNITAKAGYDGSWTPLSYFDDKIPKCDTQLNARGLQQTETAPNACSIRMQVNTSQTQTDSALEFRAPAAATDTYYNGQFIYMTKQNL